MDKIDKKIIRRLSEQSKISSGIVATLCANEHADALVRVRNPLHLGYIERNFNVCGLYPFIRSVAIKCDLKDAVRLERMQEVEYVSAQSKVFALGGDIGNPTSRTANFQNNTAIDTGDRTHNDSRNNESGENPADKRDFHVENSGLFSPIPTFDDSLDGSGVTLCVMDTGVSAHLDLSVPRERIVHFVDMIGEQSEPYDDNGHGTFVAGVAAGNGNTSAKSVMGVAPRANIVGVKVIDKSGESGTFKILDGMQWLFDNFRRYDIRVVCMSFGADPLEYADPLKIGVEMLSRSGLIVVCASGNSGKDSLKSPSISSEVISVGAVDKNMNVAAFSSRGYYGSAYRPDVYAQGVDALGIQVGGTYSKMTGTSVSAPYVAGACCLLCQKYRKLTPYQAKLGVLNRSILKNEVRILNL